ncbi:MAG: TonB-dependent receptor [Deltaproteobacteria bacterium]|nr:TonB-dependent receptor [Deltaproteobacteria bacterium]
MRHIGVIAMLLLVGRGRAAADREPPRPDEGGDEPVASVTSPTLTSDDLARRPIHRTTDLLRHVPGLVAIGRAGQADQLLVRGFDAGQGKDLGVLVDGVPINIGSHAYAHGYADTHFVIPETVGSVSLYQGAYAARFGSYSAAGTLALRTIDQVPGGAVVKLSSGTELTTPLLRSRLKRLRYRLVGLFSPQLETGSALLAAEVGIDDGPDVHPQRFRRGVVLAKWKRPVGRGQVTTMLNFYSGRWFDAGVLPAGEIAAGHLTQYSAADPTQGGIVARSSASVAYETTDHRRATWHAMAYLVDSDLRLFSNSTLFLRDTVSGDELEYVDRRVYYGIDAFYRRPYRWGTDRGRIRIGVQARVDHGEATTWHDARRLRLVDCFGAMNPCTDTAPSTRNVAVYGENVFELGRHVHMLAGVRLDQETWNVDDRDADTMLGATSLGGTGARARISPKLGFLVLTHNVDLSLLFAAGSHSTDARASVDKSGYGAFVRTFGAEVGARFHPAEGVHAAVAAFASNVAEEQIWVPDRGIAFRSETANRSGIETTLAFTPAPWLRFDAALAFARGREHGNRPQGHLIALAPRVSGTAGIAVRRGPRFASLRVRALGPRATGDGALQARGSTVFDLVAGRRWRSFELGLTVQNLFDASWREVQYASDVRPSRRVDERRDLLVTTGVPLTAMLTLAYAPN